MKGVVDGAGAGVRSAQFNRGNFTYLSGGTYRQSGPTPAFTADAAINARDYVALVARIDVAKFGGRYQPNLALGVRAGSKPGVIGAGALAATYGVFLILFGLAWND